MMKKMILKQLLMLTVQRLRVVELLAKAEEVLRSLTMEILASLRHSKTKVPWSVSIQTLLSFSSNSSPHNE